MKSYLGLIPISSKVHRRQNRMTIFCIILSVFLVTTIFSMAEMGVRMEVSRLFKKHGDLTFEGLINNTMVQSMSVVAVFLFILILIAGVLMISSSINTSVAKRTNFFGMMRCIGMSKKQIIRFVSLEALNWCKTAIPIGIVLGIIVTWGLSSALHFWVGEEFSNMPLFKISTIGIVSGAIMGVITVLVASRTPAKHASKVSPIAALSGSMENTKTLSNTVNNNFLKIETLLGINHALSIKKNFILMTSSFALSIILFLSFSVLTDMVNYIMPQSSNIADINIASKGNTNSIDVDLMNTISEINGVKRVFGRRSSFDIPVKIDNTEMNIDIISYDDFDLDCLVKDKELKKGSDISKVYKNSSYVLAIWDEDNNLEVGDKVQINNEELRIAGFLKHNPFSDDGKTHGNLTIITSKETFSRITGISDYSLIFIQTTQNITDGDVYKIQNIVDGRYEFNDRRDQQTTGTYWAFMAFIYGFLGLIALVSTLNIVNSISMSVSARLKQYGMMRAVGMDNIKIIKMIKIEAFTYALSGLIVGCTAGLLIHKFLFEKLITSHFSYVTWNFPVKLIIIIFLFVITSIIIATYIPSKRIKNMKITEAINEL